MKDSVKGGALTEVTLYVLLALKEPNHGYGIMQFVEEKTEGRLTLGAGTLYGALNGLVDKGWIEPVAGNEKSRKKDYVITELGSDVVKVEIRRLEHTLEVAKTITEGSGDV